MESKELEEKFAGVIKENLKNVDEKMTALENLVKDGAGKEEIKSLKGEISEYQKSIGLMQNQLDTIATDLKKGKNTPNESVNFKSAIKQVFEDNKEKLERLAAGDLKNFSVDLNLKADVTEAANFVNEVVPRQIVPGTVFDPTRRVHVRNLIPVATTTSNAIGYNQETAYTDGAATIAEAAAFGQSDFTITSKTANVKKIGTYVTASNEMAEDWTAFMGYLNARLPGKVLSVEDTQILYGDGTGSNLTGVKTTLAGGNFTGAGGFVDYYALNGSNMYDALSIGLNQIELVEYMGTAIFLNPSDYTKLSLQKGTDGHYLYPTDVRMNGRLTVDGVPVIKNTSVVAGDFFIGDWGLGIQLFEKRSLVMEFSNANEDDFVKDNITVRVSERVALATYRDNAFVMDTFAAAKLVIEAA